MFEYKIVRLKHTKVKTITTTGMPPISTASHEDAENELGLIGEEGWELVAAVPSEHPDVHVLYFKRQPPLQTQEF